MLDRKQVVNGTVATVAGTLLAAGTLRAFGYWDEGWNLIKGIFGGWWAVLTWNVPVPVWLAGILIASVVWVINRLVLRIPPPVQAQARTGGDFSLDQVHWAVLRALAEADGRSVSVDEVHHRIAQPRLRVEAAADYLFSKDLIEPQHHFVHGTKIALSPRGRDLLIEMNIV